MSLLQVAHLPTSMSMWLCMLTKDILLIFSYSFSFPSSVSIIKIGISYSRNSSLSNSIIAEQPPNYKGQLLKTPQRPQVAQEAIPSILCKLATKSHQEPYRAFSSPCAAFFVVRGEKAPGERPGASPSFSLVMVMDVNRSAIYHRNHWNLDFVCLSLLYRCAQILGCLYHYLLSISLLHHIHIQVHFLLDLSLAPISWCV